MDGAFLLTGVLTAGRPGWRDVEEGSQPVACCGTEEPPELDHGPDGAGFLGLGVRRFASSTGLMTLSSSTIPASRNA